MKIIKVPNKKVGDKQYWKYIIGSIPEKIIKASGLFGKKLKATVEKKKIILEKE
ncbi:MAG: hypothetical protein ABIE36_01385 [Candidatus Diapherotrites archaeon]